MTTNAIVSSDFAPIFDVPRLYREACRPIYFAQILMQLIESYLAMFAARTRKSAKPGDNESENDEDDEGDADDQEEEGIYDDDDDDEDDALDLVRMGQFRSAESGHTTREDVTLL